MRFAFDSCPLPGDTVASWGRVAASCDLVARGVDNARPNRQALGRSADETCDYAYWRHAAHCWSSRWLRILSMQYTMPIAANTYDYSALPHLDIIAWLPKAILLSMSPVPPSSDPSTASSYVTGCSYASYCQVLAPQHNMCFTRTRRSVVDVHYTAGPGVEYDCRPPSLESAHMFHEQSPDHQYIVVICELGSLNHIRLQQPAASIRLIITVAVVMIHAVGSAIQQNAKK